MIRYRPFLLCLALPQLTCATGGSSHSYDVTIPQVAGHGAAQAVPADGHLTIPLQGLTLVVSAFDYSDVGSDSHVPPLMLLLRFSPKTTGVSFKPMQVILKAPPDSSRHPVAYFGPGKLYSQSAWNSSSGISQMTCEVPVGFLRERGDLPQRADAADHALPAGQRCFVLDFGITMSAKSSAELLLDGITDGGHPVAVPVLQLSRGKVRVYERVSPP
jgi:hypothetical protein